MKRNWFTISPVQTNRSLDIVRIVLAVLYGIHPVSRIINGDVSDFGEALAARGFPFGLLEAWLVTLAQLAGSIALIVNRLVLVSSMANIFILVAGILILHIHHGWYVVGSGTNGMEYSVMLIGCFFALVWAYWPRVSGK